MCLQNHKVYVCSWFNDCLCHYNNVGDLVAQFGHSEANRFGRNGSLTPSILYDPGFEPRLCSVDHQSNALVSDCEKGRIQVCTASGSWKTLKFVGNIGTPRDAVTDSPGASLDCVPIFQRI